MTRGACGPAELPWPTWDFPDKVKAVAWGSWGTRLLQATWWGCTRLTVPRAREEAG